jgi:cyclic pyranopterin phosphate synthase
VKERRHDALLVDGFGRVHRDVRVSLTDVCNLRCSYCMPEEGLRWLDRDSLLTAAEMVRVVGVLVSAGISKIRLTGGEPLLRADIVDLVCEFAALRGPAGAPDIAMTTNGLRLPALARPLAEAGLRRVNVSLDTLDRARFEAITRRDRLAEVLDGVAAAKAAGLAPVKVNAVLVRGLNDDEGPRLLRWAMTERVHLRFIEQMPLDAGKTWERSSMVTADEILASLAAEFDLAPVPTRGSAPAELFTVDGGPHRVGVIASVSRPFCGACDRIRLTADGQLRNCLFAHQETDLRSALRSGIADAELLDLVLDNVRLKQAGHGIDDPGFLQPARTMSAIGG